MLELPKRHATLPLRAAGSRHYKLSYGGRPCTGPRQADLSEFLEARAVGWVSKRCVRALSPGRLSTASGAGIEQAGPLAVMSAVRKKATQSIKMLSKKRVSIQSLRSREPLNIRSKV
jgi:hypothetical protein